MAGYGCTPNWQEQVFLKIVAELFVSIACRVLIDSSGGLRQEAAGLLTGVCDARDLIRLS